MKLNKETGEVESSCSLPSLPVARGAHTLVTNTACGGFTGQEGLDTCTSLTEGQWTQTHLLPSPRYSHTTWQIPDGSVILGGVGGDSQADLLKPIPGSVPEQIFNLNYTSIGSCSMSDDSTFSVIITGDWRSDPGGGCGPGHQVQQVGVC